MSKRLRTAEQEKRDQIVRNRKIYSCQRCFKAKRKCDKTRPSCLRCSRARTSCEYFTKKQIDERFHVRQGAPVSVTEDTDSSSTELLSRSESNSGSTLQNVLNTEINPRLSQKENQNFTIIVSSTGEYSKFFPTCFFSYYEHAGNVSMVLNLNSLKNKALATFDFSKIIYPMHSLKEIKSKVPSREISDLLIDHFMNYIAPFVPIVDPQEFLYEYEKFWEDSQNFEDKNFLVVMFAIYFCSCTNIALLKALKDKKDCLKNECLKNLDCENLRTSSFECIENLRRMLNSDTTPSMSIIISLTLLYYVGSANGYSVSVQITNLVKYAQIFGLHRNLTTDSNELPMRSIVYRFVWYLDGLGAYYSGFPPNMHPEFFECDEIYNLPSNDIHILFLSGRLCNTMVWNKLLFEFNKIKKSEFDEFEEIETLYFNSIAIVNAINKKIMESEDKDLKYKKWLVTETRLGLHKSMLLVSALKYSMKYKEYDNYNRNITTDLVLQSMLLINESIFKVKLGMAVMPESIWFYRFAIPFQAMYIVISHIQKYPDQHLNFSTLDKEHEYTVDEEELELNHNIGDLRVGLIDSSIESLSFLTTFWHSSKVERFERLTKFRDFVWERRRETESQKVFAQEENYDSNDRTPLDDDTVYDDENEISNRLAKGLNGYNTYLGTGLDNSNVFENDDYYDAYAFLDDGSKFWFGSEY